MAEEKKTEEKSHVDLSALQAQNAQLTTMVAELQKKFEAMELKANALNDFSGDDYKHLTIAQRENAASIVADLGTEQAGLLKSMLKELKAPKVEVRNGRVAADFGREADEDLSLREVINEQIKNLI